MISSLLLKPSGPDCNLGCRYCFYRPKSELYPRVRKPRMSLATLREVVSQYMAYSRTEGGEEAAPAVFCWQGGEPTLMGVDFFRSAIALQKKHGESGQVVANSLQTNAVLLDDEWARLFARYRFLVGISLDGPAEIHDHYRVNLGGQPTHAQVLQGKKALERQEVDHNALCMVTSLSAGKAPLIWDFLLSQKLEFLQFIPCLEPGDTSGSIAEYTVRPEQYGEFLCELFDLWWPERERIHVRLFDDTLAGLMEQEEVRSCEFRQRCGDYLVVEHNGDVYMCDFFVDADHRVGNLLQRPLANLAADPAFEAFAAAKSELAPGCSVCEYLTLCRGGCQKHRLFPDGCAHAPSYLCAGYRIFFEHSLHRLKQLGESLRA